MTSLLDTTRFRKYDLNLSNKRVLLSLSGGINSAAVLCYLASEWYPKEHTPEQIWIVYCHLREHSPDTFRFVKDQIRYARKKFPQVHVRIYRNSVIKFFREEGFLPHPALSPCSDHLKREIIARYSKEQAIDIDLIGYVREEKRRIVRQKSMAKPTDTLKSYPISHLSNEECFDLVDREIGWHPAIYDHRINGKRVFRHNNCLPCKNMEGYLLPDGTATEEFALVKHYYPEYFDKAQKLSAELDSYWGRSFPGAELEDGWCKFCEFD